MNIVVSVNTVNPLVDETGLFTVCKKTSLFFSCLKKRNWVWKGKNHQKIRILHSNLIPFSFCLCILFIFPLFALETAIRLKGNLRYLRTHPQRYHHASISATANTILLLNLIPYKVRSPHFLCIVGLAQAENNLDSPGSVLWFK